MNGEDTRRFWEAAARRLALRINAGWWLERCLPVLIALTAAATCALLLWRWQGAGDVRVFWIVLGAAALVCAAVSFSAARRRFESAEQSRVRLEDHLGLKSRLTSAAAGVGAWPAQREIPRSAVLWDWRRPVTALALCAAVLAAAAWIPISNAALGKKRIIEKPAALQQVDDWVEKMREQKLADERDLDAIEDKMSEILNRPAENWYEHASLEAADHLRDQTGSQLQELARNSAKAAGAMSQMGALQPGGEGEGAKGLEEEMRKAVEGLTSGELRAHPALASELKNLDPAALKSLSPEQMKQIASQLGKNAELARKLAEGTKWELKDKT
jgi:hypothetical protein